MPLLLADFSFRYQVSINFRNYHFCGGALISSTWVLTSASCASLTETPQIRLGEHNIAVNEGTEQWYVLLIKIGYFSAELSMTFLSLCALLRITASKRVIHPSYDRASFDYDIALFKNSFN